MTPRAEPPTPADSSAMNGLRSFIAWDGSKTIHRTKMGVRLLIALKKRENSPRDHTIKEIHSL